MTAPHPRPSIALLLCAMLALAAWIAPARAEDAPPRDDEVVLQLATEGWVETETARVDVAIDAALDASDLAAARDQVMDMLKRLAPDGTWRVLRFDRRRDPAGLERWRVEASARLPEAALTGLYDRAKAASAPGRQVRVQAIQFRPTLAEREAVLAELRAEIYRLARGELEALKAAYPERAFRISEIGFQADGGVPPPRLARTAARPEVMAMAQADAAPAGAGAPMAVAEKLRLSATVVLAAERP